MANAVRRTKRLARRAARGNQKAAQRLGRIQAAAGGQAAPAQAPGPGPAPTAGAPTFTAPAPQPAAQQPVASATAPSGNTATQANQPATPTPPPSFTEALTQQFGTGNPFGGQTVNLGQTAQNLAQNSPFQALGLFGNPLETAQNRAQYLLDQNLANIGAGAAGAGLGNSSRAALTKGAAIGEAATGLGDILAQRGLQTRGEDLNRLLSGASQQGAFNQQDVGRQLQAVLGAGQLQQGQQGLNQQGQQLALQGLQNLSGLGTGLTGIAAQEQQVPGISGALNLLNQYGSQQGTTSQAGNSLAGKFI